MARADDTSLSATGTEIELSRFKRKGLGIEDDNLFELFQETHQKSRVNLPIIRGQGRRPTWRTCNRSRPASTMESLSAAPSRHTKDQK